jgi:Tol biopolymer transport system component
MLAAEGTPGLYRLVRLNPLSGKVTPASVPISIPNIGFTPSWTADGRFLFQRKGSNDIFRIDAQSGEEKLLYKHAEETGVRNPAISPDGARLAYFGASRVMKGGGEWTGTTHRWLHVMDLAGGIVRNIEIPIRGAWGASVIAWSPDSRFLVYATFDEKEPGIWIAPADGSASPRPLSKVLDGHVSHLAFSPDGKTLSFTLSTRQEDIWMMSNFLGSAQ